MLRPRSEFEMVSTIDELKKLHYFKVFQKDFIIDKNSLQILETHSGFFRFLKHSLGLLDGKKETQLKEFLLNEENREHVAYLWMLKQNGVFFDDPVSLSNDQPVPALGSICLNITHQCNLNCVYCFSHLPKVKEKYGGNSCSMSKEVIDASFRLLMKESRGRSKVGVAFFGGEPLLRFDLVRYATLAGKKIAKMNDKEVTFGITTNGTILNEEILRFFRQHEIGMIFGFDGPDWIQNANRAYKDKRGSYERVMNNLNLARKWRGNGGFTVRSTFTKYQANNLTDIARFLFENGFRAVSIENAFTPHSSPLYFGKKEIELLKHDYKRFIQYYYSLFLKGDYYHFFHFSVTLKRIFLQQKYVRECGAGSGYLAISADGSIYPCHKFTGQKEFYMGNVLDGGFDYSVTDRLWTLNVDKKKCASCWAKYLCGGGCLADAFQFNQEICQPEELYCELAKHRMELTYWLYWKLSEEAPEMLFRIFGQKKALKKYVPKQNGGFEVDNSGHLYSQGATHPEIGFELNESAFLIWKLSGTGRNVEQIAKELRKIYKIDYYLSLLLTQKTINRFIQYKVLG